MNISIEHINYKKKDRDIQINLIIINIRFGESTHKALKNCVVRSNFCKVIIFFMQLHESVASQVLSKLTTYSLC